MEPNKFEQHIKEELNKREIQPTNSVWDNIAQKLDEPQKIRKPKYLWWGIAASFVGLLIVSSIYFNSEKSQLENDSTVVETDNDQIETKKENLNKPLENSEENQLVNTPNDIEDTMKVFDENTNVKREKRNNYPQKNEITKVTLVKPQLEIEINKNDFEQEKLIEQKITELISSLQKLEKNNRTLTDLEVDSLILKAQQEIIQNKIFRQDQSVDAMALLNEVEDELDKPLKDQLFDLLKKGIFETRNAIADRN